MSKASASPHMTINYENRPFEMCGYGGFTKHLRRRVTLRISRPLVIPTKLPPYPKLFVKPILKVIYIHYDIFLFIVVSSRLCNV